MQALLDDRNRKIENMEEATPKSPNVNSDEWKKKKERLALLRSDQKQLDDRIKALKSLEQTYMTLNGGLATVTLNLIYATPDSKVGIPVPVLSRDAIGP